MSSSRRPDGSPPFSLSRRLSTSYDTQFGNSNCIAEVTGNKGNACRTEEEDAADPMKESWVENVMLFKG